MAHRGTVWLALLLAFTAAAARAGTASGETAAASKMPVSRDGALLASVIGAQRKDVILAGEAFFLAVQSGVRDPAFLSLAERLSASEPGDGAADHAVLLARQLPMAPLSQLILGDAAVRDGRWADARGLYASSQGNALLARIGPVQQAWALFGAGSRAEALATLQRGEIRDPIAPVARLQAARIAEAMDPALAGQLYSQLAVAANGLPAFVDLQVTDAVARWRISRGDRAGAQALMASLAVRQTGLRSAIPALLAAPVHQGMPSAREGLAAYYVSVACALESMSPSKASEAHAHGNGQGEWPLRQFATILLRQALWLDPTSTLARLALAETLRADHQPTLARDVLQPVSAVDPLAPLADRISAAVALQQEDNKAAAESLGRIALRDPGDLPVQASLGDALAALGRNTEALAAYSRAISLASSAKAGAGAPGVWPLLLARAIVLDELARHADAERDLTRALELAPDEPALLNYIGYSSIERGEGSRRSVALLRRAAALAPADAAIRDSYAWSLLEVEHDRASALPLLTSAAEAAPNDPEIAYHLGVAYWRGGRYIEARDQWNQALGDSPAPATRRLIEAALEGHPAPAREPKRESVTPP